MLKVYVHAYNIKTLSDYYNISNSWLDKKIQFFIREGVFDGE